MKAFLHAFIFAFGPILRQRAFSYHGFGLWGCPSPEEWLAALMAAGEGCGG